MELNQEHLILVCSALFSLCIGSFLNVCIYRLPKGGSVSVPSRSHCPKCDRQLEWWENIPVLSWVVLMAKCKGCKTSISVRYPLVELLSLAAAILCLKYFGFNLSSLIIYLLTASLIVITFIDFDEKIIPNLITYPGMTFGLLLGCVAELTTGIVLPPLTEGAMDSLMGFLFGGLFFLVIGEIYYRVTGTVGLGGGDIKLTAMTGSILGVNSLIPTIFGGSVLGSIVGIGLMVVQGSGRKTELAFGPWLAIGALIYIFFDIPLFRLVPS